MVEFSPGVEKTALVLMTNPTARTLSYDASLYLGVTVAAVSNQSFSLGAHEARSISFPITMPTVLGDYPIYLDVSSGGVLLAHYQSSENVVISLVPWEYSNMKCSAAPDPVAVWWRVNLTAIITNIGNRTATKTVYQYWRRTFPVTTGWYVINTNELTLAAGEARSFTPGPNFIISMPGSTIETYLVDGDGYGSAVCQVFI